MKIILISTFILLATIISLNAQSITDSGAKSDAAVSAEKPYDWSFGIRFLNIGATAKYYITSKSAVDFDLGFIDFIKFGITAAYEFNIPVTGKANLYFGPVAQAAMFILTSSESGGSSIGGGALLGIEWNFASNLALSIDSRHLIVNSTGNGMSGGSGISEGISYDPSGAISLGLKWKIQ